MMNSENELLLSSMSSNEHKSQNRRWNLFLLGTDKIPKEYKTKEPSRIWLIITSIVLFGCITYVVTSSYFLYNETVLDFSHYDQIPSGYYSCLGYNKEMSDDKATPAYVNYPYSQAIINFNMGAGSIGVVNPRFKIFYPTTQVYKKPIYSDWDYSYKQNVINGGASFDDYQGAKYMSKIMVMFMTLEVAQAVAVAVMGGASTILSMSAFTGVYQISDYNCCGDVLGDEVCFGGNNSLCYFMFTTQDWSDQDNFIGQSFNSLDCAVKHRGLTFISALSVIGVGFSLFTLIMKGIGFLMGDMKFDDR